MRLTERQRWNVIRQMVKDKNNEFSGFVRGFFNQSEMRKIVASVRDTFLIKCKFATATPTIMLNEQVKLLGRKPDSEWYNDLSSEDLLIFMDYKCQILQKLYKHYKMYRTLNYNDVQQIIKSTKVSQLIDYNDGKLMLTGQPELVESEVNVANLEGDKEDIINEAMSVTLGYLSSTYAKKTICNIDYAKSKVLKLKTYNIDPMGHKTGYEFRGEVKDCSPLSKPKLKLKFVETKKDRDVEMRLQGFDVKGHPIYLYKGEKVNFFRNPIPDAKIAYDVNHNKIEQEEEDGDILETSTKRSVGYDIEGRPVYEDKYGYYNSIGDRLPDDVYIQHEETFNQ